MAECESPLGEQEAVQPLAPPSSTCLARCGRIRRAICDIGEEWWERGRDDSGERAGGRGRSDAVEFEWDQ